MKSVFRYLKLSHVLFASLFWCIGVFLFAGNSFGNFEKVFNRLNTTRHEAVLTHLKQFAQLEIDKGTSLPQVRGLPVRLSRFASNDADVPAIFVFSLSSGKILFSSQTARAGETVPADWVKKCERAETFFTKSFDGRKTISLPVSDSSNTVAGCICLEYDTKGFAAAKETMIAQTIRFALGLCLSGTVLFFSLFFLAYVRMRPNVKYVKYKTAGLSFLVLLSIFFIVSGAMHKNDGFLAAIKTELSLKSKTLAKILQTNVEKAVQNGIPLKALVQADSFLENVRRQHKEIKFILITDESGRVLYEGGSASAAFEADKLTGHVRLRDDYLNAAEPLRDAKGTLGWVQIGVGRGGGGD